MFGLFRRKPAETTETLQKQVQFDEDGFRYPSPGVSTSTWLAAPFAYPAAAELGARLAQIHLEGFGQQLETTFLLSWKDLYALLRHPELGTYRNALLIPPETTARPRLMSQGALMDPGFAVLLDEWVDEQGRRWQPAPTLRGRVLLTGVGTTLLPEGLHQLLDELERFHSTPVAERTLSFKELSFGRIRKLAIRAGCPVSDYVAHTIVLTPDKLRLTMERRGEDEDKVVEVIPGFDDAPSQWLNLFDRLPLQDSYDVPNGPSMVRVLVSPEVKSVLAEIT